MRDNLCWHSWKYLSLLNYFLFLKAKSILYLSSLSKTKKMYSIFYWSPCIFTILFWLCAKLIGFIEIKKIKMVSNVQSLVKYIDSIFAISFALSRQSYILIRPCILQDLIKFLFMTKNMHVHSPTYWHTIQCIIVHRQNKIYFSQVKTVYIVLLSIWTKLFFGLEL